MLLLLRSIRQPVKAGMVNASLGHYAKLLVDREAFKTRFGRHRVVAHMAALVTLRPISRLTVLSLLTHGALGRLGDAEQYLTSFSFRNLQVDRVRRRRAVRVRVATVGEIVWMQMPLTLKVAPDPLWLMKLPSGEGSEARA